MDKPFRQVKASTSSDAVKRKTEDEETAEYLRRKHKFIKSTIRMDYQRDVCKDYKETGFCGFGDSCKFLHDRSDYKHGWQIEQEFLKGEYEQTNKEDQNVESTTKDDKAEEKEYPSLCNICDEPFKDPIETKCKHYFCSKCAEKECSTKCVICDKATSGIFKNASKILKTVETKPHSEAKLAIATSSGDDTVESSSKEAEEGSKTSSSGKRVDEAESDDDGDEDDDDGRKSQSKNDASDSDRYDF